MSRLFIGYYVRLAPVVDRGRRQWTCDWGLRPHNALLFPNLCKGRLADRSLGVCRAGTALLYTARFTSNCPPEMLRLSGMPIKIKDRPFKFGTRL